MATLPPSHAVNSTGHRRCSLGSDSDEGSSKYPDGMLSEEHAKKTCADCGTTKTPLWRGGPAGPKSLCNACGIRSRKKRRAIMGLNRSAVEEKKKKGATAITAAYGGGRGSKLKKKLMRKMGEEEQAAVLLMALSYGSVYA